MNYTIQKIREMLEDIFSYDMQRKTWLNPNSGIMYIPEEIVCTWFDDTLNDPQQLVKTGEISEQEWEIIKPFHKSFEKTINILLDPLYTAKPYLLLQHKEWLELGRKAKNTLEKLNSIN